MVKCCRWGWLVREGDTESEARIKTIMFPFTLALLALHVFLISQELTGTNQLINLIGNAIEAIAGVFFMGGVLSNVIRVGYLLDMLLVLGAVGIMFMDIGDATRSYPFRAWTLCVLSLDCALIFQRDHIPRYIITLVLLQNVAVQAESVERFGLFEAGYWGTAGVEISACNCASPPCSISP
eukprot:Hpha_TRINITY_DN15877_c2_g1::TRINITY_DN15877_c2_g1_i1::g.189828::m.189828